jgi:arylsulfatase A-like enzyme
MRWPGKIPPNQVQDAPAAIKDLLTTLVPLAGGTVPTDRVIDGEDLWPLLTGKDPNSPNDAYYYFHTNKIRGVQIDDWKFIPDGEEGQGLYNLGDDIGEHQNVIDQYPDIAHDLQTNMTTFDLELEATSRPRGEYIE